MDDIKLDKNLDAMQEMLVNITARIIGLCPSLLDASEVLSEARYELEKRRAAVQLSSEAGIYRRAEEREAHVALVLETEGLAGANMQAARAFKALSLEKEMLSEISSNLRTLVMSLK